MLSQAEIDALLAGAIEIEEHNGQGRVNLAELMGQEPAAQKAQTSERNVQPYNFWSPDRFSKEQMRAVEMVHEDLAERLTTSLPSFLRTNLRPRVVHIEQGRFHDFLKDLPANSLFHVITLAPLPGQLVLMISPDIGVVILEQRLGGRVDREKRERNLTEIDQSLLRGLVEHMMNDLKAAWSKVVTVEPGIEDTTVNQHWVQMMMGNERMMLVTFELTIQDTTGTMNIYIPFSMLKPIANDLNPHAWIAGKKRKISGSGGSSGGNGQHLSDQPAGQCFPGKIKDHNSGVHRFEIWRCPETGIRHQPGVTGLCGQRNPVLCACRKSRQSRCSPDRPGRPCHRREW